MPGLWFINWQKQYSLTVPPHATRRLDDQAACDLAKAGETIPLAQLFAYTEIGSEESLVPVAEA